MKAHGDQQLIRLATRFLCFLLVFCASASAEPLLRVTSPVDGTHLTGGSEAVIAWETASLPEGVEEWEAFLSLNDGRYYAVRITPHLHAHIRSFRWRVPNVTTNAARLLIRIGDEREEKSVELPMRFSIDADRFAIASPNVAQHATSIDRGEAARPGDRPVAEWVSGRRDGGSLATRREALPHRVASRVAPRREPFVAAEESSPLLCALQQPEGSGRPLDDAPSPPPPLAPRASDDLLLQTSRLNI